MHPRFVFFPWQRDYSAQGNVFCLYAMSVSEPGYRSSALNTDSLGFRVQYDFSGEEIDLLSARRKYPECILLLGNSTSFGVSLTADRKAMGVYLGRPDCPCINLSVRGATMQQELAIFQTFKHLLPPVRKIISFTGVCDVSLATQADDVYSDAVGSFNGQDFFRRKFQGLPESDTVVTRARERFLSWADRKYSRFALLQRMFEKRQMQAEHEVLQHKAIAPDDVAGFERRLSVLLGLTNNVMETWSWISQATGAEVTIFLQPVLGWTSKPKTRIETLCTRADAKRVPAIAQYANRVIYDRVVIHFSESCSRYGLSFCDMNAYFDALGPSDGTLFTDICHLTDSGTEKAATRMLEMIGRHAGEAT